MQSIKANNKQWGNFEHFQDKGFICICIILSAVHITKRVKGIVPQFFSIDQISYLDSNGVC